MGEIGEIGEMALVSGLVAWPWARDIVTLAEVQQTVC